MTRGIVFIPNFSCGPCIYCNETSDSRPEDLVRCDVCRRPAHFTCLKSGVPSSRLLGDNFFHYSCVECSPKNSEVIMRAKLTMVQVLLLALYNLHVTSKNDASKGFFHYRTHVHNFIMSNWIKIYSFDGQKVYKEKNKLPPNCISGQLCHSSYFIPGKRRGGWYRLKVVAPPSHLIHNSTIQIQSKKRTLPPDLQSHVEEAKTLKLNDCSSGSSSCSTLSTLSNNPIFKEELQEESSLESVDESSRGSWYLDVVKPGARLPSNIFDEEEEPLDVEEAPVEKPALDRLRPPTPDEEELTMPLKLTSLFSHPEKPPTEPQEENKPPTPNLTQVSLYEERKLIKKLDIMKNLTPELYRLRRKLKVRQVKREHGLSLFNIDIEVKFYEKHRRLMTKKESRILNPWLGNGSSNSSTSRILDRFQVPERHSINKKTDEKSFRMKLTGSSGSNFELIHSPYSLRKMKPFIFRDYLTIPLKLALLQEILGESKRRRNEPFVPPTRRPIDYCYVTPKYIPAMNHLAREFFWPGIDLSEVLHYPDFTCVVLYGQLVIGFGIIVPDTKHNEAYVSFLFVHPEWRRAGLAKFILYHLIQTCPGKDITLHVSATNPALIMYQQFGFKAEEFLSDFYDKYLPEDSPECKHSMLMRLRR